MIALFLILVLLLTVFSIAPIKHQKAKDFWLYFFGFIFFLLAAFRHEGIDNDFLMYKSLFRSVTREADAMIEPTFYIITQIIKLFSADYRLLFVVYALTSIVIKVYAIKQISEFFFLSLSIWLCNAFILHDMTQIRASVGSSLMLLSLLPIVNRNYRQFIIIICFAIMFHYTALIAIFFIFLKPQKFNKTLWLMVIPAAYCLVFLKISPLDIYKLIPINTVQFKIKTYIILQDLNTKDVVNIFSLLIILKFFIIAFFVYHIEEISKLNRFAIISLKLYILSVAILISVSEVITLSLRLSEFIGIVEIVLIPMGMYIFSPKNKIIPIVFIVAYACLLFGLHIRAETLNFY